MKIYLKGLIDNIHQKNIVQVYVIHDMRIECYESSPDHISIDQLN